MVNYCKRLSVITAWVLAGGLFCASVASATSSEHSAAYTELQKQFEQLRQENRILQKQIVEIRDALQGSGGQGPVLPHNLTVGVADSPFKGPKDAKLVLVEFSDYECPFCRNFISETLPRLEQEFISTGKVKYVRRDFPIEAIHQNALKASAAANCAGKQGKYWQMHRRLFANQNHLRGTDLPNHAKAIDLDIAAFESCLTGNSEADIRRDIEDGRKLGVQGTPTFFVGVHNGDENSIQVRRMIVGAQPYEAFKQAIESVLAAQ
jgi:protein-disulfide isomerase